MVNNNYHEIINFLLEEIRDWHESRGPEVVFQPELFVKARKENLSKQSYELLMDVLNESSR